MNRLHSFQKMNNSKNGITEFVSQQFPRSSSEAISILTKHSHNKIILYYNTEKIKADILETCILTLHDNTMKIGKK